MVTHRISHAYGVFFLCLTWNSLCQQFGIFASQILHEKSKMIPSGRITFNSILCSPYLENRTLYNFPLLKGKRRKAGRFFITFNGILCSPFAKRRQQRILHSTTSYVPSPATQERDSRFTLFTQ